MLLTLFITYSFVTCYYSLILRHTCGSGHDGTCVPSASCVYCTNKALLLLTATTLLMLKSDSFSIDYLTTWSSLSDLMRL